MTHPRSGFAASPSSGRHQRTGGAGSAVSAWLRSAVAVALFAAASLGLANDRPYLATNTAAAEEDDEGVWSVETQAQSLKSTHAVVVAPEYAFTPTTSLQLEITRSPGANETELEFKQLFNHIARDGWGWGAVASWQRERITLKLPYSLRLWDGDGALHLNAGVTKPRDERRRWIASAAIEREVFKRGVLFAELARQDEGTLAHGGLRYWLKRDRLALDVSLQRVRVDGTTRYGVVLGLGFYDLR